MSNIKFPSRDSLPGRALSRLLQGQHLTHRSFQNQTSSYRLAHFVWILHEYGWPIRSIEKTAQTNDPIGRIATYSEYFLFAEDIYYFRRELGESLDRFVEAVSSFEGGKAKNEMV